MRNLTQVFLESAPCRTRIPFGINENIILKDVSNMQKRDNNGSIIDRNCYLTFAQLDLEDDRKIIAESTYSYFNISEAKYATASIIHQYKHLIEISNAVLSSEEAKEIDKVLTKALISNDDIFRKELKLKNSGKKQGANMVTKLKKLQFDIADAFVSYIKNKVGEKSDLVSLIIVTNKTGKYLDLPREDLGFIAKKGSKRKLVIDNKYINYFKDKDKPEVSEGDNIGEGDMVEEQLVMADEDQGLDGI